MNSKTMSRSTLLLTCFLTAGLLRAQIPNLINYQGRMTVSGAPASGTFSIRFSIHTALTGGTELWFETQNTVQVANGIFNVLLGSATTGGIPNNVFTATGDRYLAVRVGVDPEISPRFRLTSVAFAIRATEADGVADGAVGNLDLADNAVTAQKIAANNVVKSINSLRDNVTLSAGSNVTITPSGNILTIAASGGTGGITIVNAGSGLAGGGSSSSVTLSVAPSGITSSMIGDGQVGNADIANFAVNSSKIAGSAVGSAEIVNNSVGSVDLADFVDFGGSSSDGNVGVYNNQGKRVTELNWNGNGGGFVGLRNIANIETVRLTGIGMGVSESGYIAVFNSSGAVTAGINGATGEVFGRSKPFIIPDPRRPDRMIKYTAIEGPEAAIYTRGKANLVSGRAYIKLPDHFSVMAVPSSITVNLTPRSADSKGLAAIEVTAEAIQVAELSGGTGSYMFDYVVYAARRGYENYQVYFYPAELQSAESAASKANSGPTQEQPVKRPQN